MARLRCPQCGQSCRPPDGFTGLLVRCPNCRARIEVDSDVLAVRERAAKPVPTDDYDREEESLSTKMPEINPEELIDMTAMVDIVFFLLIFFLVTSMSGIHSSTRMPPPEQREQGEGGAGALVALPKDKSDSIVVTISRDDRIEVDGHPCPDLGELPYRLREAHLAAGPGIGLLVLGHAEATHGAAIAVLDAGYEVGIDSIQFAVTDEDIE